MKNNFLEKTAPLIVSASLLAYLMYSLFWLGHDFTLIHFVAFLLVSVLVLIPFVSRIKVPNIIEFDTKLDKLREHTDEEIGQLRDAISSITNVRVNPILNQYTFLGSENQFKQMLDTLKASPEKDVSLKSKDNFETDLTKFYQHTRLVLDNAQMALKVARTVQIAYEEKRRFDATSPEEDIGPEDPFERTYFLINCMINGGLKYFIPEASLSQIITQLETYRKLTSIYRDVHNHIISPPSIEETFAMLEAVSDLSQTILAGISLFASQAVIGYRKIEDAIPYFCRGEMPPESDI